MSQALARIFDIIYDHTETMRKRGNRSETYLNCNNLPVEQFPMHFWKEIYNFAINFNFLTIQVFSFSSFEIGRSIEIANVPFSIGVSHEFSFICKNSIKTKK